MPMRKSKVIGAFPDPKFPTKVILSNRSLYVSSYRRRPFGFCHSRLLFPNLLWAKLLNRYWTFDRAILGVK